MGILEIHLHDPELEFEFEWNVDTPTGMPDSLPFVGASESESGRSAADETDSVSAATPNASGLGKFRSIGLIGLAVGGAIAFNRLRSRRARKGEQGGATTSAEGGPGSRRLSLFR